MQADSYIVRDVEGAGREETRLVNQAHHRMIQLEREGYENADIKACVESYNGVESHVKMIDLSDEQIMTCYTHSASRAAAIGVKAPLQDKELANPEMRVLRFYISRLEAQTVLLGEML